VSDEPHQTWSYHFNVAVVPFQVRWLKIWVDDVGWCPVRGGDGACLELLARRRGDADDDSAAYIEIR
jgi:hypothetical protein